MPIQTEERATVVAEEAARKQVLLREANERISELTTLLDGLGLHLLICGCSDDDCAESVVITPAEYDAVRGETNRSLVVDGHQLPAEQQIVGGNGRFLIVETMPPADAGVLGDERAS
jgi:hypothetical protein